AARRNPQAVGVIGSRRMGNEDAFVLQKFARETLATPNVDSMASVSDWPALRAILDAGLEPVDNLNAAVRQAEVIMVVGDASQAADVASVKMQNMSRYNNATIVQINPYRTQLSKWKTIDLRIKPATEAAALTAIAQRVAALRASSSPAAAGEVEAREPGAPEAPAIQGTLPAAQPTHGLPDEAIEQSARAIAEAKTALFAVCTGHWLRGRAAAVGAAVANLALASGKVSGEGNGVVFLPEKNNSMGTMEAGVLADRLPGFKPASEEGLTVDRMLSEDSGIQALYVVGENTYDRLPNVPLIVQDILMSETAKRADVLLPASSYVERQGTFTNFEGTVQWFNRAIPPVGQSRPDWTITTELAKRVAEKLGQDAKGFSYGSVTELTREFEQAIGREVPPPPIVKPGFGNPVGNQLHDSIMVAQEARAPETPLGPHGDSRFTRGAGGPLPSPLPVGEGTCRYQEVMAISVPEATGEYPLMLISGPQRWVNGTTSRYADGLLGLYPLAKVTLSPGDAAALGLEDNDDVRVSSASGGVLMKVEVNKDMPRGVAMIPGYVQPSFVVSEGEAINRLFERAAAGAVPVKVEKREERELGFAGFNEQVAIA
ncbi:MAG TPA: molybdopterin-dependent oxidoreductase, partial [Chloroflexota bacterium]|nr:molybdopterin-dependent oxidoreductase [Chloroflexota bacterium]